MSKRNLNLINPETNLVPINQESNFQENISENILENNSENISENLMDDKSIQAEQNNEDLNWYVEIPSVNLKAPINETTNMEILENFVGHFEETPVTEGNICLAAHNRGYKNNYFKDLNKLKKGEEIKYKYNDFEKIYLIENIEIIKNTNWSYLENTKENKITLITCVEDKPDLRLCIQAIQK